MYQLLSTFCFRYLQSYSHCSPRRPQAGPVLPPLHPFPQSESTATLCLGLYFRSISPSVVAGYPDLIKGDSLSQERGNKGVALLTHPICTPASQSVPRSEQGPCLLPTASSVGAGHHDLIGPHPGQAPGRVVSGNHHLQQGNKGRPTPYFLRNNCARGRV